MSFQSDHFIPKFCLNKTCLNTIELILRFRKFSFGLHELCFSRITRKASPLFNLKRSYLGDKVKVKN